MLLTLPGGKQVDIEAQLQEFERVRYEDSLYEFLKAAWKYIDPSPWVDSWAVEAVAEHLQAVADGEIRRLMIHIPPRMGKSSLCSVAFPAWVWAQPWSSPTSGPSVPFLSASYDTRLSVRDNVKCRRLIESPWYQRLWGDRFQLTSDQNTKSRFSNDQKGERLITSISAGITGEGGNIILVDDPNAANEVASEATTQATNDWWDGTMSSRLNDAKTGAYVVIQQRLGETDLSGHILEKEADNWVHVCLPMRYEPDRSFVTAIGWKDPRTEPGELLCPERFGEAEVAALEKAMGPWIAAGQLQQRPEPKGGGIIKRDWWQLWDQDAYPPMDFILASLDTAYTEKEANDYSAMTIWGVFTQDPVATASRVIDADGRPIYMERVFAEQAPKVMLMNAWQERLEFHDLVTKVVKTCKTFKVDRLVIEAKASGHSVAQELRRIYGSEDFGIELFDPGKQDKVARLHSVAHLWAEGIVHAPDRAWADMTITQVSQFPKGRYRDLVDTCSQGLRKLRDMGLLVRAPERLQELEDMKQHNGRPPEPLYPS